MKAFVMCGPQGGGKSFQAGEIVLRENATLISGDAIKEELFGSADIQGDWVRIHNVIEEYVSECAGMGLTVILDGTYFKRSYRAEAMMLLKSYGYDEIELVVCNPSLATCLARNFQRKRSVPDYVLKTTYEVFQRESRGFLEEGFYKVTFVG